MRRMTPAKLLILIDKQQEQLSLHELPVAASACLFYNMNRDPGDEEKGRPPAAAKTPHDFRVFGKRRRGLAAKDEAPGPRLNLDGAKADRGSWSAWAQSKAGSPQPRVKRR